VDPVLVTVIRHLVREEIVDLECDARFGRQNRIADHKPHAYVGDERDMNAMGYLK
jgi:hypothetical protein